MLSGMPKNSFSSLNRGRRHDEVIARELIKRAEQDGKVGGYRAGVIVGDNPFSLEDTDGVGAIWIRNVPNTSGENLDRGDALLVGKGRCPDQCRRAVGAACAA